MSQNGHEIRVGIAVCTPIPFVRNSSGGLVKDKLSVDWHRARMGMGVPTNIIMCELAVDGKEVGEARDYAVKTAQSQTRKPEFLFFIDYDVIIPYDALTKLLMRARSFPDHDIIAGVYCSKSSVPEPLIYKRNGEGPYWDWTVGDLVFDLASVHMGCTLIRMSLFDRLGDAPWFVTQNTRQMLDGYLSSVRGTEDIYFCDHARSEADAKIMVDTSVLCGHQDGDGTIFGLLPDSPPMKRCKWHPHQRNEHAEEKKAIDIGAGGERRQWDGYKTYTTDIRKVAGVDYVMDSLAMNLPDEEFDLVASSHHLEHIPRWRQEDIWREMFRILKPGGTMEHTVPNVVWAANHLVDGHEDVHVHNVLYGAQEQHGYERELNTHFFGYTPVNAKALAEGAGLVDVEIVTYRDDPVLGYNMVVKGRKPTVEDLDLTVSDEMVSFANDKGTAMLIAAAECPSSVTQGRVTYR